MSNHGSDVDNSGPPELTEALDRVLIMTSTFPPESGDGTPRFILDLAKSLQPWMSVEILTPHSPGSKRADIVEGVDVKRFRYFFPSRAQILTSDSGLAANIRTSWAARLQSPFLIVAQVVALLRSVKRFRPAVVNCHWLVPQGLAAAVARTFVRFPIVLHVHAADAYLLRRIPLGGLIARFVVSRSAAVLADGSHVRSVLDNLLGYQSGASLRPMGVWSSQFEMARHADGEVPDTPDEFVLFVGRLVEKKGVEYLIRAMVSIRHPRPNMELVIIGDGPLRIDLVALADELALSAQVHFLGSQDHRVVAALMHKANVICVPSIVDSRGETEGMPTVVLEAMAAGARVVGSAVDGIPDVLRDVDNGWLVEPADQQSLAAGILAALTHPEGDVIAARGSKTAMRHDWRAVAEEYASVLQEAARG